MGQFVPLHEKTLDSKPIAGEDCPTLSNISLGVVRDLIELLDLTGVVFTFDALHCQKADATPRRR